MLMMPPCAPLSGVLPVWCGQRDGHDWGAATETFMQLGQGKGGWMSSSSGLAGIPVVEGVPVVDPAGLRTAVDRVLEGFLRGEVPAACSRAGDTHDLRDGVTAPPCTQDTH